MKNQKFKRIFVVDDDPMWSMMLCQMLEDLGYTNIKTFPNGAACLENMHLTPAIVFLDYQMDDMNGLEVLQKIKGKHPATGVVFCSANETMQVALDAMQKGSFDYVLKSKCGLEELSIVINEINDQNEFTEKVY
jgi:DNA-binding NtrC family response regulator